MQTGVDLVDIPRIASIIARHGDRFLQRIYTATEIEAYGDRTDRLAARWAAKEAVAKALGCGIGDISWTDIEVLSESNGAPVLHLYGSAAQRAQSQNLTQWSISLSHTEQYAIAFVVAMP